MGKDIALKVARNNKVITTNWLANFLKDKNISKLFGLSRLQYNTMKFVKWDILIEKFALAYEKGFEE
jgi:hypothetical protein